MRSVLSLLFKIRVLSSAVTVLTACGPATTTTIFHSYRHPLLNRQSTEVAYPEASRMSVEKEEPKQPASFHRSFTHPLLNRNDTPGPSGDRFENRLALARRARKMLSSRDGTQFKVEGKTYRRDCSGFVEAVLAGQGIFVDKMQDSRQSNGVAAIYRWAADRGAIHRRKVPAIGDLVFFDNTYDRNQDGRMNDRLTHIAIVERVDADGTVSIIHHVRGGLLRYKLNRFSPSSRRDPSSRKVLNHYLRVVPGGSRRTGKRLTGELFQAFATIIH